jgi:hypothetical protein
MVRARWKNISGACHSQNYNCGRRCTVRDIQPHPHDAVRQQNVRSVNHEITGQRGGVASKIPPKKARCTWPRAKLSGSLATRLSSGDPWLSVPRLLMVWLCQCTNLPAPFYSRLRSYTIVRNLGTTIDFS